MSLPDGATIKEGKFYVRRDGAIVGPMTATGSYMYPWRDSEGKAYCTNGRYYYYNHLVQSHLDLVAGPFETEIDAETAISTANGIAPVASVASSPKEPPAVEGPSLHRQPPKLLLPADSQARKDTPVYSGLIAYFPLALAAIAQLSKVGNDKHNPGQPLHWSRGKSNDHLDCIARHLLEAGTIDAEDNVPHSVKLAWRALANLQIELEAASDTGAISRA